jgi:purine-nucleoside phosphorylase
MLEKIKETTSYILRRLSHEFNAETAVVLGSGLGNLINEVEIISSIAFSDIPHLSDTSIEGHSGQFILASYKSKNFIVLQGRIHFYEGHSMDSVTYPIKVLKYLGIKTLLLTNAAGGMNPDFSVGDLMIITDHINLMPNPLIGIHYREFGERFPDMSVAYNKNLIDLANHIAGKFKINIKNGVYVGVTGPTYETPAEYRYFRIIGGDAVGMSTVPEVIVAHQMGIKCFAVSVITDLGVPGKIEYLSHEHVQKVAEGSEPKLAKLVLEMIETI